MLAARLAMRGYSPRHRTLGTVHTFAFIPQVSWHAALLPDLAELGPLSLYDYAAAGFSPMEFFGGNVERRREMNRQFVTRLREVHATTPIDWLFIYASGVEVLTSSLRAIRDELGIPVVMMCLDDKQSWAGPVHDGQHHGTIDLVPLVDLGWTSASVATVWYLVEGGIPVYLPEGFDRTMYRPSDEPKDIEVSFIGDAYGFRPDYVSSLRAAGIAVETFGRGWGTRPVWGEEQVRILNRSLVNLGHGGIGYSDQLTNVKTRDFEIPGTGGGVYITTFNPDLARHFDLGSEILCFRSDEEAIELIRWALSNPEASALIARRARERCLREHRWLHRYTTIVQLLGVISPNSSPAEQAVQHRAP